MGKVTKNGNVFTLDSGAEDCCIIWVDGCPRPHVEWMGEYIIFDEKRDPITFMFDDVYYRWANGRLRKRTTDKMFDKTKKRIESILRHFHANDIRFLVDGDYENTYLCMTDDSKLKPVACEELWAELTAAGVISACGRVCESTLTHNQYYKLLCNDWEEVIKMIEVLERY